MLTNGHGQNNLEDYNTFLNNTTINFTLKKKFISLIDSLSPSLDPLSSQYLLFVYLKLVFTFLICNLSLSWHLLPHSLTAHFPVPHSPVVPGLAFVRSGSGSPKSLAPETKMRGRITFQKKSSFSLFRRFIKVLLESKISWNELRNPDFSLFVKEKRRIIFWANL